MIVETDGITVDILTSKDNREYDAFIARCPFYLIQHERIWKPVIHHLGRQQEVYLGARRNGQLVGILPAFVFRGDLGSILESTPHAGVYGGIVSPETGHLRDSVFNALLSALTQMAQETDCLVATIATPPFTRDLDRYRRYWRPEFEKETFYQYLPLATDPLDQLTSRQRSAIRRGIRKADQHLVISDQDNDDLFSQWYAIYQQRFAEIDARCVSLAFFQAVRKVLEPVHRCRVYYAYLDNELIGGSIFIHSPHVMDYLASAFVTAAMKYHPANAIIYRVLCQARTDGLRYFNWKSSPSMTSGVFQYKARWGSQVGYHHYLTKIIGDISQLRTTPLAVVRNAYPCRYVMPYEAFENK